MILTYHKVHPEKKSVWWVPVDEFYQHMRALTAKTVVHLDEYDPSNPDHVVITFDGVYDNVHQFAAPILERFGFPYELFVIGDLVGGDNSFEKHIEPACDYVSLEQLEDMASRGARIQWHTRRHPRLNEIGITEAQSELTVPPELADRFLAPHMRWFAYPHGVPNEELRRLISERFVGALACDDGDKSDRYFYPRKLIYPGASFYEASVALILANYNYGRFLRDAIHSVEQQTSKPDEILIIDDASTDDSGDVLNELEARGYKVVRNSSNLGIVENFRKAVSLTRSDYICFLGADNRFRSDYVELCRSALDNNQQAAVAYTDATIFGPLAGSLAEKVGGQLLASSNSQNWNVYSWNFPDPEPHVLEKFETENFVHGSSMYRRKSYEAVGGYAESNGPEDHNLFFRMWKAGGALVHVKQRLLEYRQHSPAQANSASNLALENQALSKHISNLNVVIADVKSALAARNDEIEDLRVEIQTQANSALNLALENQELSKHIPNLTQVIADVKSALAASDSEIENLRDALAARDDEIKNLRVETKFLRDHIEKIEQRAKPLFFLAFHRDGRPRGWIRFLLLKDQKTGVPRSLGKIIIFKKNHLVRPVFKTWYSRYDGRSIR